MSAPAPLAAVVLAGGASRRMGRDKATLAHPDSPTTMVEHTVEVLRGRCSPVFVIAAPGQALPPLQAEVLRDEIRGVGPLLATGRGLRAAAAAGLRRAFVSAVDMPYLSVEVIEALVSAGERSMRALADTVVTQRVVVPFKRELANINSPDDLTQQILR